MSLKEDFSGVLFIGDSRTVGLSEYGDLGQAEIVLIYDRERFETFWLRTDPADGLWTLQKDRSLLTELGLSSTLPERCVLEEFHWAGYVERTLIWGYGELP